MNTVIFSDYDSGFRSSALLLRDDVDWGLIDRYMYKEQIPHADEIVDYDDEKLFTFFRNLFNAYIGRIVIIVDGKVPKDVKLKGITLYGYCWGLWLDYVKNDKEFRIALPCYKTANKENYRSLSYSIATVDNCSYTIVFSTMFLSELKDGVKKFLNGEIGNE